jgi:hypothetical protein
LLQGCEFNVASLSCESKSADANSTASTTYYCSSNDTACASCTASSADPICLGEDGSCICSSLCSAIESAGSSDCTSAEGSINSYVGIAVGVIGVGFFVALLLRCRKRYLTLTREQALEAHHRRESELLRMRQPQLALNLVGWRDTVELDKPQLHKLGACSYDVDEGLMGNVGPDAWSTGKAAASELEEGGPSTSMETASTFSDLQSPVPSPVASATLGDNAQEGEEEGVYSAMTDSTAAQGNGGRTRQGVDDKSR